MKNSLCIGYLLALLTPVTQAASILTPDAAEAAHYNASASGLVSSLRRMADGTVRTELPIRGDETWVLPVHSARLSPGQVIPRALNMPGLQPFFLVGGDPSSLAWLRQRVDELNNMGAVGLAVEVPDNHTLALIRAAAPGLTILPVSGDDIATRLRIEHYPVLITATSLAQ